MKSVFAVACLLLLGSHGALSALSPIEGLAQLGDFFTKVKDMMDLNLKATADPVRCLNVTSQLSTQHFEQCQQAFREGEDISHQDAMRFCQNHCSMLLSRIIHELIQYCDLPPGSELPDNATMILLQQSCDRSEVGDHEYCLEVWSDLQDPSHYDPSYGQCLAQYDGEGACPNVCKTAEHWVADHIGCCYKGLIESAMKAHSTEGLLIDKYWNACGVKEPNLCPTPRKN